MNKENCALKLVDEIILHEFMIMSKTIVYDTKMKLVFSVFVKFR